MGCSISKEFDLERPSRKSTQEAWEAVLARGLAIQLDTGFGRMSAGYIAAIFSANYASTLRQPATFKTLHRDDLLLCHHLPSFAEDYPQSKERKPAQVNARASTAGLSASLEKVKEPLTGGKSIGGAKVELETIDTWELMKDLSEQEDCQGVESLQIDDYPTLMTSRSRSTTPLFNKPSHDSLLSTASSDMEFTALIPRSKSLTSFQSTEDGNVCVAASKDVVLTPEQGLCAVLHGVNIISLNEVKEFSRPSLCKLFNKMYQGDIEFEDGGLPTYQHTCETMSNTELWPISSQDERPAGKPLNIQRALSMKYILNDNTSDTDQSHFSAVSDAMALIDEANSKESNEDDWASQLASLSCESECSSSLSSPEFSATASLKDWLPSDSPSFTLADSIEEGLDTSIFEAMQASHIVLAQQMTAYLLPNTRRVLSKYVGGGEFENVRPKGLQPAAEASMLSFKVESCGVHTYDIKLVGSLDTATHKEHYASLSLVDSPCNLPTPVDSG